VPTSCRRLLTCSNPEDGERGERREELKRVFRMYILLWLIIILRFDVSLCEELAQLP